MDDMDAASTLREARQRSGLTLRQLSVRAATSHSTIAAYESAAKVPTVATLARLFAACGFDAQVDLRSRDPFSDRRRRGEELREVLDLADQLPARDGPSIAARFPAVPS